MLLNLNLFIKGVNTISHYVFGPIEMLRALNLLFHTIIIVYIRVAEIGIQPILVL